MSELELIRESVRAALTARAQVVLAVSGGLDSMVLLDAVAATLPAHKIVVATFDHGTGAAAIEAAALVGAAARQRGLRVRSGVAREPATTEAAWRDARLAFLREVAAEVNGAIVTAHTEDDQIETVLMRVMRGAGARGLAGLYAEGGTVRPLIAWRRRALAGYVQLVGLAWVEDPTNESRRFFRNRVRHDLLPAMRVARPAIDEELLDIARQAAVWRAELERAADAFVVPSDVTFDVAAQALTAYPSDAVAVLWAALAGRVGLALDRRGMARLASFTRHGRVGSRIQLSGGWEVTRARDRFELRRGGLDLPDESSIRPDSVSRWGSWAFRPMPLSNLEQGGPNWSAWLPTDLPLTVRAWRAGDAMAVAGVGRARKVKRFLSDAGVTGHARARWPVVLAGDQIVWIPGVSCSNAATERSGRPGLAFTCELNSR